MSKKPQRANQPQGVQQARFVSARSNYASQATAFAWVAKNYAWPQKLLEFLLSDQSTEF
jgi:hypothetical protein